MLVVVPTVAVGVVAALVTIGAHGADPAFIFEQQHPTRIEPGQLVSILTRTREPVPTGAGRAATSVRCIPGERGAKLNPWRCSIHYGSGGTIEYRIIVQPSGRFHGVDRTGARVIEGCCLRGGSAPPA
jgi:hypothetical protein